MGRTDDVINVAGHRLETREIEESINSHAGIAECVVVGVADALKGQAAMAFAVVKNPARLDSSASVRGPGSRYYKQLVQAQLGAIARPACILFVEALPKTRSGKVLLRAIVAVCEGRDPGALDQITEALQ